MKNEHKISFSEILIDQPGILLEALGCTATLYVAGKLLLCVLGLATVSGVDVGAAAFMGCWAVLGDAARSGLSFLRERVDDALRIPRYFPSDWINPSSLTGLAFKGAAEPNEQVVCDAVRAYLGRSLGERESVAAAGRGEAIFSYETEEKLYRWKFAFSFRSGRDEATGEPFVWITAAHVYAI